MSTRKRVALLVYVDLDQDLVESKAEDKALRSVSGLLDDDYGQFNPIVAFAPDSIQPRNGQVGAEPSEADVRKVLNSPEHSGEIPKPSEYLPLVNVEDIPPLPAPDIEYPSAGSYRFPTAAQTVDMTMTYNTEGTV